MRLAVYEALWRLDRRHGEQFIVEALKRAVGDHLTDCHLSLATEERIAERAAPWQQSKDELAGL